MTESGDEQLRTIDVRDRPSRSRTSYPITLIYAAGNVADARTQSLE